MTSRLQRLLRLDTAIREGNFPTAEKLCGIAQIQPRTLFKDLKELRKDLGCDIRYNRVRGGYYNASPDKKLPSFALTSPELTALTLAAGLFSGRSNSAIAQTLQSALHKIVTSCDETVATDQKSRLYTKDSGEHAALPIDSSQAQELYSCIKDNGCLEFLSGELCGEIIKPHSLILFDGRWGLVGYSKKRDTIVTGSIADSTFRLCTELDSQDSNRPNLNEYQLLQAVQRQVYSASDMIQHSQYLKTQCEQNKRALQEHVEVARKLVSRSRELVLQGEIRRRIRNGQADIAQDEEAVNPIDASVAAESS